MIPSIFSHLGRFTNAGLVSQEQQGVHDLLVVEGSGQLGRDDPDVMVAAMVERLEAASVISSSRLKQARVRKRFTWSGAWS